MYVNTRLSNGYSFNLRRSSLLRVDQWVLEVLVRLYDDICNGSILILGGFIEGMENGISLPGISMVACI